MSSSKPVCRDPDSLAFCILDQALRTDVSRHRAWKGLAVSLLIHMALMLTWFMGASVNFERSGAASKKTVLSQIFVPLSSAGKPRVFQFDPLPRKLNPAPVEDQSVLAVAIDLNAMSLSFSPDVSNQLPAVVEAQGGVLALLDKENPSVARYIFQPPSWRGDQTTMDVTGRLRILMDPPQKWPLFREIAVREGLDLDSFRASAIFDISYRHCLQDAIRNRIPASFSGKVSAARLVFRADSPCGVKVLNVSLRAAPEGIAAK